MPLRRDDHPGHGHTERIEHFHEGAVTPGSNTNVNVGPSAAANDAVTAVTRVVMLVFTVLEVLLLFRFTFKLTGANAAQPLIAWLYAFTDPLVRPVQGIFPEPRAGVGAQRSVAEGPLRVRGGSSSQKRRSSRL